MRLVSVIAVICISSTTLSQGVVASITINSNIFEAEARDTSASPPHAFDERIFTGTSIPMYVEVHALTENSVSRNAIDWSSAGGQTVLEFDLHHLRDGEVSSTALTEERLRFTANATVPFELSGFYNVTDGGAQNGHVSLYVIFADFAGTFPLFENSQSSINTHNERFTLGETAGDVQSYVLGSLTGTLIAGHEYELFFAAHILAFPDQDSGATAAGNITLTIGASTSGTVPEPVSMLVWGGLSAAVGLVSQRRRAACIAHRNDIPDVV